MEYAKNLFIALVICGLFTSCSVPQTNSSKPVEWPSVTPIEPSGTSIEGGRFQSRGGGFQIDISEMPFQTSDFGSEKARAKGIDVGKQYAWRFEKTLYTIMYAGPLDPDGNPLPQPFEDMVSGSRTGALRQNARIVSEKPFTSGEFRGTELRYVNTQGVNYIGRLFMVNDVGYQVVGGYVEDNEREVLSVLNSFKLLSSNP